MSDYPFAMALIAWAAMFAAASGGMWIGSRLPTEHRTSESRDMVRAAMGMVSTLTALALGLLISSANTSFNAAQDQLMSTSSNIIRMDRMLRLYGPEVDYPRQKLRAYAKGMMRDLFPPDGQRSNIENDGTLDFLAWSENKVALLVPTTDSQRWLLPHMLDVSNKLVEEHFALVKQEHYALPTVVIALLLLWLLFLFGSYGLFSPRHLTAVAILLLSSATAAGAIFLILELQRGTHGIVRITSEPLLHAIDLIDRSGSQ